MPLNGSQWPEQAGRKTEMTTTERAAMEATHTKYPSHQPARLSSKLLIKVLYIAVYIWIYCSSNVKIKTKCRVPKKESYDWCWDVCGAPSTPSLTELRSSTSSTISNSLWSRSSKSSSSVATKVSSGITSPAPHSFSRVSFRSSLSSGTPAELLATGSVGWVEVSRGLGGIPVGRNSASVSSLASLERSKADRVFCTTVEIAVLTISSLRASRERCAPCAITDCFSFSSSSPAPTGAVPSSLLGGRPCPLKCVFTKWRGDARCWISRLAGLNGSSADWAPACGPMPWLELRSGKWSRLGSMDGKSSTEGNSGRSRK